MRHLLLVLLLSVSAFAARTTLSFDPGWSFLKSDAPGAEQPNFNDGAWRKVDVPHDWSIEGSFDVLAVRTDTSAQPASRWYSGAGIYRHVRLVIQDPVHLERWSTFVTTPQVSAERALVHLAATVDNQSDAPRSVALFIRIGGLSARTAPSRTPTSGISIAPTSTAPRSKCAPEKPRSMPKPSRSASASSTSTPIPASG